MAAIPAYTLHELDHLVEGLLQNKHATSTQKTYAYLNRTFLEWCRSVNVKMENSDFPFRIRMVNRYLAMLNDKGKTYSTMMVVLAALNHYWAEDGMDFHRVIEIQGVKKAVRLSKGTAPRKQMRAVTAAMMARLWPATEASGITLSTLRDRALLALGYGGLMRRSEIIMVQIDGIRHVADDNVVYVHLPKSKCDQDAEGVDVVCHRQFSPPPTPTYPHRRYSSFVRYQKQIQSFFFSGLQQAQC
jgi:site-specific recombinase XerD